MTVYWRWIVVICCFWASAGWGQGTAQVLSLKDCIRIALEKNTTILTNRNQVSASANNYKASFSKVLPSVSLNYGAQNIRAGVSTSQQDVPIIDPNTGAVIGFRNQEVQNDPFERNFYSASLTISQNLFNGGANWNSIRRSKADKNAVLYNLDARINETIRTVSQNYFDLLKQEKILEVNQLAVQRSQDNLERTQKMFEIGSVAKVDVFRARVNLGNDRIALISQRNTVQQARQTLNISLGIAPNAPIEIAKEINYRYQPPDLEELLQQALQYQPELKRREMDIRARELSAQISKSAFLPTISGFFTYDRDNTVLDKLYSEFNKNWSVRIGISGSWNLFNGFQDMVNYQNAKIDEKNARLALEEYRRQLESDITTIYQRYNDLLEIVEINEANLEAAREEFRLATERYRLGAGTSLDLREAQVNLTDAERILVAAEYDLIIAYIQLQEVLGTIQSAIESF